MNGGSSGDGKGSAKQAVDSGVARVQSRNAAEFRHSGNFGGGRNNKRDQSDYRGIFGDVKGAFRAPWESVGRLVASRPADERVDGGTDEFGVAADDMLVKSAARKGVPRPHNAEGAALVYSGADLSVSDDLEGSAQHGAGLGGSKFGVVFNVDGGQDLRGGLGRKRERSGGEKQKGGQGESAPRESRPRTGGKLESGGDFHCNCLWWFWGKIRRFRRRAVCYPHRH